MWDLFCFVFIPLTVVVTVIVMKMYQLKDECQHEYGDWTQQETEHAYVQMRICCKCNYAYVHQFRKMGSPDERSNESNN